MTYDQFMSNITVAELMSFIDDLPTRYVTNVMRSAKHRQNQQKWEPNDFIDIVALPVAAVYCVGAKARSTSGTTLGSSAMSPTSSTYWSTHPSPDVTGVQAPDTAGTSRTRDRTAGGSRGLRRSRPGPRGRQHRLTSAHRLVNDEDTQARTTSDPAPILTAAKLDRTRRFRRGHARNP
jgi:hypothetical protein